jgi:hypothetical protein
LLPQCQLYHIRPSNNIKISKTSKLRIIKWIKAKKRPNTPQAVIEGDKAGRRNLYKKLGLPPEDSAKEQD